MDFIATLHSRLLYHTTSTNGTATVHSQVSGGRSSRQRRPLPARPFPQCPLCLLAHTRTSSPCRIDVHRPVVCSGCGHASKNMHVAMRLECSEFAPVTHALHSTWYRRSASTSPRRHPPSSPPSPHLQYINIHHQYFGTNCPRCNPLEPCNIPAPPLLPAALYRCLPFSISVNFLPPRAPCCRIILSIRRQHVLRGTPITNGCLFSFARVSSVILFCC